MLFPVLAPVFGLLLLDDPIGTWLYIDPHRGTIPLRVQPHNRNRRWLYNGLHKFDLPWIYDYDRRLLWAGAVVVLSVIRGSGG